MKSARRVPIETSGLVPLRGVPAGHRFDASAERVYDALLDFPAPGLSRPRGSSRSFESRERDETMLASMTKQS
jgi:hypothetical protein